MTIVLCQCLPGQSLWNAKGIAEHIKTYGKEEVTNIMGQVDSNAHVCEVEPVTQGDEGQSDDMVSHKLFKVLARLLHAQQQNNGLLRPVRSLKQIVKLDHSLVGFMWEGLVHASRIEVPYWRSAHNINAHGSHK